MVKKEERDLEERAFLCLERIFISRKEETRTNAQEAELFIIKKNVSVGNQLILSVYHLHFSGVLLFI